MPRDRLTPGSPREWLRSRIYRDGRMPRCTAPRTRAAIGSSRLIEIKGDPPVNAYFVMNRLIAPALTPVLHPKAGNAAKMPFVIGYQGVPEHKSR